MCKRESETEASCHRNGHAKYGEHIRIIYMLFFRIFRDFSVLWPNGVREGQEVGGGHLKEGGSPVQLCSYGSGNSPRSTIELTAVVELQL